MKPFAYHQPARIPDAAKLLTSIEDSKLVAGGMTLIPTLKQRLANPPALVDLSRLGSLKGISDDGATITIGAMTPHAVVAASKVVQTRIPGLAALASMIGDPAVRSRGTIGGSVANNDPAADYPAGVLGLGATITIGAMTPHAEVAASKLVQAKIPGLAALASMIGDPAVRSRGTIGGSVANNDPAADYPAGVLALGATIITSTREIAADKFFLGLFETALEPGEIITAIRFPMPLKAGYAKFKAPASRYALVGVFVAKVADGVRVAVTGAGPGVFRVPPMEAALSQKFDPSAIAAIRIDTEGLTSDIHAEADYRAHLVTVMAKRAVDAALS